MEASRSQPTRQRHQSFASFASFTEDESDLLDTGLPAYEPDEVRRYEDFHTIDWVQDASREHQRKEEQILQSRQLRISHGRLQELKDVLWEAYDAGQAWIVVTLVGLCIGINAACLNILTEFLSDLKTGHCSRGWYLNKSFCCWGESDEAGCGDWQTWSSRLIFNYVFYIVFAVIFSSASAYLVKHYAPYAAGSGISEIKCIIGGFVMKGFLGAWTLLIKSIGLPLSIASGLSVGKEGPSVHVAVCTGNVISRFFDKYNRNAAKMREIYCAASAAGVAVAFGSPIGGILFALEEMSANFPLKTMWRSFFCALVATASLAAMNPFRTGQLVMFTVQYDRDWHFFEIIFFSILGIFGGFYGEFVMKWNLRVAAFRKRCLGAYGIQEAVILAGLTAVIAYWNPFLQIDMTKSMQLLFKECEGEDYDDMCSPGPKVGVVLSLLLATMIRTLLVIISYGCKVPAGIFVPSMAIGASFGRAIGMMVAGLQETFPHAAIFSACKPDVPCITPGTYAFLGAAAALSGIMHITVSVVVIMFELTGALTFILPTMIVVGVTKVVADNLGRGGGIADRMIFFNGFPFLDAKEEQNFGIDVAQIMVRELVCLPVSGMTLVEVEQVIAKHAYRGFPVVESHRGKTLLGYIGHRELSWAVVQARKDPAFDDTTKCYFSTVESQDSLGNTAQSSPIMSRSPMPGSSRHSRSIDFAHYIDPAPLAVNPRLPLETAMDIFKTMGPRVILVEHKGRLVGLITIKDVLKFEHSHNNEFDGDNRAAVRQSIEIAEDALVDRVLQMGQWVRARTNEYAMNARNAVTRSA